MLHGDYKPLYPVVIDHDDSGSDAEEDAAWRLNVLAPLLRCTARHSDARFSLAVLPAYAAPSSPSDP